MSHPFAGHPAIARFQITTRVPKTVLGVASRDAEGVKLAPTGLTDVNASGTEMFDALASLLGFERDQYGVVLGGDKKRRQICCVIVPAGTTGASPVRRDEERHAITLYLHELFKDMPSLRPTDTRWCRIFREPDGAEGEFIMIDLNSSLPHRTISGKRRAKK